MRRFRCPSPGIPRRLALTAVCLVLAGCSGRPQPQSLNTPELLVLRAENARLGAQLDSLVASDSLLAEACADSGDVVLAMRHEVLEELVGEITRRYLSRVELDLAPDDLEVVEHGTLKAKMMMARVTAGEWSVRLRFHHLRAALAVHYPRTQLTSNNRIHLMFPVSLEAGRAQATLQFGWKSKPLVGLVCKDFSTRQDLEGVILAADYRLDGDFEFTNPGQSLLAWPLFPPEKFLVRADLTPDSWARVRETLKAQDELGKCGLLLNPDDVLAKLRALGRKGFNVKLPRTLFHTIELPARVNQVATVEGRRVQLSVRPITLLVSPRGLWYSAEIHSHGRRPEASRGQRAGS